MQALATQASSAGMQSTDLTSLNTTFGQLKTQVQTLVTGASLNTNNVLAASSGTALSVVTNPTGSTFSISLQDVAAKTTSSAVTTGIGTAANASAALTSLTTMINDVSTAQGNLSAYSTGLQAVSDADTGLQNNLNATINAMTRIDSTALQTQLQNLNNQQSIDYYLVSQMNTESAAILAIFR
jgi:flagellin-like hook-associated protein FlgL